MDFHTIKRETELRRADMQRYAAQQQRRAELLNLTERTNKPPLMLRDVLIATATALVISVAQAL